jgi:hypothetical protein
VTGQKPVPFKPKNKQMKNQQASQSQETTMAEKMRIVQWLSFFPALTLMAFTRQRLGFRVLKPTNLIGITMVIWVIQGICNMNILIFHTVDGVFSAFPWVFLAAGFWQRRQRWQELRNGQCCHTYSSGISFLERIPFLPAYFKDQRRLYRWGEPVLLFFLSMGVGILLSQGLARWMALSAIAMAIYEQNAYDRQLERDLDILDSLVESEVQTLTVKHFTESKLGEQGLSLEQSAGVVSTGAAYDIKKQIERLRAKRERATATEPS